MPTPARLQRFQAVAAGRQRDIIVVLEDIYDPHNAAAILRSCDAFGVQDVYIIFEKQKPFNLRRTGKVSSSSANKWLTMKRFTSSTECYRALRKAKYKIVVTALQPGGKSIWSTKLDGGKIALVIGNEHTGVSATALKAADIILNIPMRGLVESLNVSVTAAICIFEITRQRLAGGKNYGLSKTQQKALVEDFIKR